MQHINFLKTLSKNTSRISALLMVCIVLGVFVVLILTSLIVGVYQYHERSLEQNAKKNLIAAQKEYEQIAKTYPLLVRDIPLANQVNELEQAFRVKKEEFDTLEHLIIREGFSSYMRDLAETTPNTLWLKNIHIDHGLDSITLVGYSIRPDAVSELMNALLTTPAYKQVPFNLFFVKKIKNHPYVAFSIATKELGSEEELEAETKDKLSQKPKE